MNGATKEILKQAQEAINKAIEDARKRRNEEDRKYIVAAIGKDLIRILTPLLNQIAANSRLTKQEIQEIISQIKIEAPQVNVGSPQVDVKTPTVNVPPIIFPKEEMIKAIKQAIAGVKIGVPNVEVKSPPINIPKKIEVKGIAGYFNLLGKALAGKLNVGLEEIDRDKPLHVVLVDKKGNYYTARGGGGVAIAGRGGGPQIVATVIGSGNVTVASAGTAVQLSSSSIPCKRVVVHAVGGHIVVGDKNAKYTAASRKGVWLAKTQREFFNVDNLDKLWVDAAADSTLVSFYYEK